MRIALLLLFPILCSTQSATAQDPVPRAAQQLDVGLTGAPVGVAVHGDGERVAVVYLDGGFSSSETVFVVLSDDGGDTFGAPVRVDHDPSGAPKRVTRDSVLVSGDNVYVLWRDARGGTANDDLYFNRSSDGGLTFQTADVRLGDGAAGSNEVFDWRFAHAPDPGGDDLYVLMTSEIVSGNGHEELFLVVSLDGGANWSNAIHIGGDDAAGVDVDQLALAVEGTSVHMAWEDDGGNSATDSVLYQKSTDAGATLLPMPIALDPSDTLGTGDAASSADTGLSLSAVGGVVLAAWPEERTSPADEELRVAVSLDGGNTWSADQRVGGYDPTSDDIDSSSALVLDTGAGPVLAVAWEDNRSQLGYDEVFAAVSTDGGLTFNESRVSGALGGALPRLAGADQKIALLFTTVSGLLDRAAAVYSIDGGAVWSGELALSDNVASDSDGTDGVFVIGLDNVMAVFLNDASGSNGVWGGGFSLCTQGAAMVRNSGSNPLSLTAEVPRLGAAWNADVDLGLTGHGFAALLGFATPADLTLSGGQVLLVNPADPAGELLGLGVMGGNPAQFVSVVPSDPTSCGFALSIQALHFGSASPFALSNAVDLILTGL